MASIESDKIYLVNGKRTPFGKFGGSLKDISPVDLAVTAAKAAIDEIGLDPSKIQHVILGNVVPSTTDTIYGGRHLALKLGCPVETPGYVVNRLCGSGIQSILDASRLIKMKEAQCVLAAGSENMSLVPHLTYGARFGTKYGALKNVDMLLDSLTDKYTNSPMGITAEKLSEQFKVTRSECDVFALNSHIKAAKAYADGHLQGEISPVELKRGSCEKDEHLRESASIEDMNNLRAAFKDGGVVTAASASGIVDGAAAVIVASGQFCIDNKLTPLAEIVDGEVVGVDPTIMGIGPSPAIKNILSRNKMTLEQIDLVEINEAFAGQTLSCVKDLGLDEDKLNIWGGAVALGHPLGASGTRISLTLARQLHSTGGEFGIASACIGGGQGIAVLLKRHS
ncbi:thiolase family protein [Halobacteriovorax sp. HLS]|uniref:thiolase family protein n=1 Tax=Halobacteriovorax sp. HLS TaxID=2234000 RepID=UPI000FD9271C|nr:thiolase family protein [Halobacteriovorax sp. HLS]